MFGGSVVRAISDGGVGSRAEPRKPMSMFSVYSADLRRTLPLEGWAYVQPG